jgi:hypothetical protein
LSLSTTGICQVLAIVPPLTDADTPMDVDETTVSCTFRNATVKICTVIVSEGWFKVTATVTGSVPVAGFGKTTGVEPGWTVEVDVEVDVDVGMKVGVNVAVSVGVAEAIVTVAPVTGNPLNSIGSPLFPAPPVILNG